MSFDVDLQIACKDQQSIPEPAYIQSCVESVLSRFREQAEITVRIVDVDESQTLNHEFRDQDKPTNVLSFPFIAPPGIELPLLGDLVICQAIIAKEATEQNKPEINHWSHMLVHGCLHLLGYDHIDDHDAEEMEALEVEILNSMGIADPYL
ncbi:rRNA maturation RNase YbeY [Alginatibacterium sediminis]|uniref:Endoribonuclease YbeY n=1 Tax=Alginatibacterium sediminis TaxID=2164068 RepID=A0A420E5U3_9ALTE|nr:rRNA maturation RNase YbeY [Alginatibacterium sediminis]RKF12751.1 rRNA maturation RNase YbeY [Alginatibacterium sediminis]